MAQSVEIISRDACPGGPTRRIYQLLDEEIAGHHPHLAQAKIALAWHYGWKEDADGHKPLAQIRKCSTIDRLLHGYDFVIEINHESWNAAGFNETQQRALLAHELCHAQVQIDKETGEEKVDDAGHVQYRLRKHDIEEFREVVERFGCWKADLEKFALAAVRRLNDRGPLFDGVAGNADPNIVGTGGDGEVA